MYVKLFGGISGSFDDIESDGRKIVSSRDPPGQKCVYINPGFCVSVEIYL